jgi:hypothetical protein
VSTSTARISFHPKTGDIPHVYLFFSLLALAENPKTWETSLVFGVFGLAMAIGTAIATPIPIPKFPGFCCYFQSSNPRALGAPACMKKVQIFEILRELGALEVKQPANL